MNLQQLLCWSWQAETKQLLHVGSAASTGQDTAAAKGQRSLFEDRWTTITEQGDWGLNT